MVLEGLQVCSLSSKHCHECSMRPHPEALMISAALQRHLQLVLQALCIAASKQFIAL